MKFQQARIASICAALVLAACGGGGTAHDAPAPAPAAAQTGVLQGAPVLTASFAAGQLKQQLQAGPARDQALLALAGDPVCDVQVHAIRFSTLGGAQEQTVSSGALMVPGGADPRCRGAKPIVLYAHATHPERSFNLARLDDGSNPAYEEALTLASLYASQGFIVIAPNYAGYDVSTLGYHPFLNAQQQSHEMIDAWNAGRDALTRVGAAVSAGGKLFLTGYSEGGHVAMATQRSMQQAGIAVTAAAPMSGPYALAQELDANFAGQVHVAATLFGTLIATSFQKSYGNVYANPGELYEARYAAGIESLLPGADAGTLTGSGKLPESALFSDAAPQAPAGSGLQPTLDAMTPARGSAQDAVFAHGFGADHLFTNAYRLAYLQDLLARPDRPANGLRIDAKTNDLRGWLPTSPVLLCGGAGDATVSFAANTLVMQQQWAALGGAVSVLDLEAQPTGALDPFAGEKLAFGALKAALQLQAQLTTSDPAWEVARNYHAALFPFCASAARRFFLAF
jgi:hypothetical protein